MTSQITLLCASARHTGAPRTASARFHPARAIAHGPPCALAATASSSAPFDGRARRRRTLGAARAPGGPPAPRRGRRRPGPRLCEASDRLDRYIASRPRVREHGCGPRTSYWNLSLPAGRNPSALRRPPHPPPVPPTSPPPPQVSRAARAPPPPRRRAAHRARLLGRPPRRAPGARRPRARPAARRTRGARRARRGGGRARDGLPPRRRAPPRRAA
jgi:hypothetical protein